MIAPLKRKRKPASHRGLVAGVVAAVALAVAIVAAIYVFHEKAGRAPAARVDRNRSIDTINAKPAASNTTTNEAVNAPAVNPSKRYEEGVEVVTENIRTNSSGAIIEKLTLADGRKIGKIHPPKPIFENACDQVIALALSTKPGQSMPPLPNLDKSLEQDFIDSLGSPIVINEDDPDEVKLVKAQVKEAKAYLVEEIKRGGSLLEILREHQAAMERNADNHLMAIQEMEKLRAESGERAARDFIKAVNESFKVRGIPEIELKDNQGTNERN